MTKFLWIAAALVSTGTAFPAQAEPRNVGPRTELITFGDSDLTSQAGSASLQRRVREAYGRVCDLGGNQTIDEFAIGSRCYSAAVADGLRQVNAAVAMKKMGPVLAASALTIKGR